MTKRRQPQRPARLRPGPRRRRAHQHRADHDHARGDSDAGKGVRRTAGLPLRPGHGARRRDGARGHSRRRFPDLEHMAYALVGWIAVKLFIETWESFSRTVLQQPVPEHILHPWLFWTVMAVIIILGCIYAYRKQKPQGNNLSSQLNDLEK